ncbi:helix-turn-helix domain-containing protein [Soonwooa sp.]|uniref:helix-turn-helix domain-containing protein n=1 Tax=Soonwooa sp. TaxID=1938592 RepID=UPI0026155221|nr:helix-turn-helix domain-containing protein [Soonwooa sp.]
MFRPHILIVFMFFVFSLLNGQKNNDFSSLVDKSVQKIYQNPDEAISFIQSFMLSEQNPDLRLVLQNLMAQAYAMKGDYVQSVRMSLDKESTFNHKISDGNFAQLFRDYALSEQYQNLKLYDQSTSLITEMLKNKALYKSDENYSITLAKVFQLQAINYSINRKTEDALSYFQKSNDYLKTESAENLIIKTENQILVASILLNQKKGDEARKQFSQLKTFVDAHPEQVFLFSLVYERLARINFEDKDYHAAIANLEKSLANIEGVDYLVLKSRIYEMLAKNYLALQDEEKYRFYIKLSGTTKTKIETSQKEGIRYLLKLTEIREQQLLEQTESDGRFNTGLLLIGFGALVLGLGIYYFYEYKRQEDLTKQVDFFKNQKLYLKKLSEAKPKTEISPEIVTEEKPVNKQEEVTEDVENDARLPKKTTLISKEKEDEILQKLDELENSDRFLNKDMSLAVLAGQLETNTKYLSETINKYKGKNFNLYINELRVNYIAYMLKTNPIYLNYKVSYLAEVSGFSSHSAFTTVFKSITGMSPNAYIQQINQSAQ